ncbi:hypothetical protein EJ07DRAFT_171527 [Lizonia empirigonia]|nr:hypothetical protein EJ07DRAFT_171527 [Lizonia empirigonia]
MDKLKKLFKHDSSSASPSNSSDRHTGGISSQKPSGMLMTTNHGDTTIALYSDKTPKTCQNFTALADAGKYKDVIFHRIIPPFMLQGGESIWGGSFDDETLRHTGPGVLSMANSGPGTNGSQFFITLAPTPHLDGKHAVFGQGEDGLNGVERIGRVGTGEGDRPLEDVAVLNAQSIR